MRRDDRLVGEGRAGQAARFAAGPFDQWPLQRGFDRCDIDDLGSGGDEREVNRRGLGDEQIADLSLFAHAFEVGFDGVFSGDKFEELIEAYNNGSKNLGLVGIKRRGVPLAQRIGRMIEIIEKEPVQTGMLDISFYRDDLTTRDVRPVVEKGELGFDVNGRDIILMDDVLYTGRTIRAALDALFDHGRPKSVQLLVLIDRGHRELPIEAKFIGRIIPTSRREIIEVKLQEIDGDEQVLLVELVD